MPRTLLIQVKVDEAEKAQIAEVAKRAGMAPSAYLRHVGLSEHQLQNKPDFDKDGPAVNREKLEQLVESSPSAEGMKLSEERQRKAAEDAPSEEDLRAKAMELVRTKGLNYRTARAQVDRKFSNRPNLGRS